MYNMFYIDEKNDINDYIRSVRSIDGLIRGLRIHLKAYDRKVDSASVRICDDGIIIDIEYGNVYYKLVRTDEEDYHLT